MEDIIMKVYLSNTNTAFLENLRKDNPNFVLDERKIEGSGAFYDRPFVIIGHEGNILSLKEECLVIPDVLVSEFEDSVVAYEGRDRTPGVYLKDDTRVVVKNDYNTLGNGKHDFQVFTITGKSIPKMQEFYREVRAGKVYPTENWKEPQVLDPKEIQSEGLNRLLKETDDENTRLMNENERLKEENGELFSKIAKKELEASIEITRLKEKISNMGLFDVLKTLPCRIWKDLKGAYKDINLRGARS